MAETQKRTISEIENTSNVKAVLFTEGTAVPTEFMHVSTINELKNP